MITLPPGFDVAQLISDFSEFAVPIVAASGLITIGIIIINLLNKASK